MYIAVCLLSGNYPSHYKEIKQIKTQIYTYTRIYIYIHTHINSADKEDERVTYLKKIKRWGC